jgi:cellulose biosynthesis protein BcsQ
MPLAKRIFGMKIISSVGAKGGSGKSSVALFLAWEMAKNQKLKVAILDADIQGTCISAKVLNPKLPFDVYSVIDKTELFKKGNQLNQEGYDVLIIDGNPRSINEDPELIKGIARASDLNLIISRPTPRDLKAQIKYVDMIKKVTEGTVYLLWNFFQKNTAAHRAGIPEGEKMLGLHSLKTKLGLRVAYQDVGFTECYIGDLGNAAATNEIRALAEEVKGVLNGKR